MESYYQIGVAPKITIELHNGQTIDIKNANVSIELDTTEVRFMDGPVRIPQSERYNVFVKSHVSEEEHEEVERKLYRLIRGD